MNKPKGFKKGDHPVGLSGRSTRIFAKKNGSREGTRPKTFWTVAAVPGGGHQVKQVKTSAPKRGWSRTYA